MPLTSVKNVEEAVTSALLDGEYGLLLTQGISFNGYLQFGLGPFHGCIFLFNPNPQAMSKFIPPPPQR